MKRILLIVSIAITAFQLSGQEQDSVEVVAGDHPVVWNWRNHSEVKDAVIQTISIPKGYLLQAKIPLTEIGAGGFRLNELYGLEIALDMGDEKGRKQQLRWNSPDIEAFHTNPSLWGEARIIEYLK